MPFECSGFKGFLYQRLYSCIDTTSTEIQISLPRRVTSPPLLVLTWSSICQSSPSSPSSPVSIHSITTQQNSLDRLAQRGQPLPNSFAASGFIVAPPSRLNIWFQSSFDAGLSAGMFWVWSYNPDPLNLPDTGRLAGKVPGINWEHLGWMALAMWLHCQWCKLELHFHKESGWGCLGTRPDL